MGVGSDVRLELATPGSLEGTVLVDRALAPERFSVQVVGKRSGVKLTDTFFRTDGHWRMPNVPAGPYEIVVEAVAGTAMIELDLAPGEQKRGIDLALTETVSVAGTLVDLETGMPVAGMRVSIGTRTGVVAFAEPMTHQKRGVSDADGRFEVERAPVGPARLTAWTVGVLVGSDYGLTRVPLTIAEGPGIQEIGDVALVKDRLAKGGPNGSLGLELEQSASGEDAEQRRLVVAFVRPDGPAAIAGVAVGDEIVAVDGHDVRGTSAYRYARLIRAAPGSTVKLTLSDDRTLDVRLGPPD